MPEGLRKYLLRSAPADLVAALASLAVAVSYGFNSAESNQTLYAIGGFRKLDPELWANDWLLSRTMQYHPAFDFLEWPLLLMDRGGWALAYANLAVIAASGMFLYYLMTRMTSRGQAASAYLLLTAIVFTTLTKSVGMSYAYDRYLQPSMLGTLGIIAAIALFGAGHFLASGIAAALAGLFHANYLVLGFPVFALAHALAAHGRDWQRRVLEQFAPMLVALLLLSPLFYQSLTASGGEQARQILFKIRSPHHYDPQHFRAEFAPFVAWQLIGIGAAWPLLESSEPVFRRVRALLFSMVGAVWAGTILTTTVYVTSVAQVFVFRLAPYVELVCQGLACVAAVRVLYRPSEAVKHWGSGLVILVVGLGFMLMLFSKGHGAAPMTRLTLLIWGAVAALALLGLVFGAVARRWTPIGRVRAVFAKLGIWPVLAYSAYVAYDLGHEPVQSYRSRSSLYKGLPVPERDLYSWVRDNTPKGAVFLTPPELERFRLVAQRAIVVDWKGSPYRPDDILEWWQRLEDVSGVKPIKKADQVFTGYRQLDPVRLERLRQRYGFGYAVVHRGTKVSGYKDLFRNAQFSVIEMPTPK